MEFIFKRNTPAGSDKVYIVIIGCRFCGQLNDPIPENLCKFCEISRPRKSYGVSENHPTVTGVSDVNRNIGINMSPGSD